MTTGIALVAPNFGRVEFIDRALSREAIRICELLQSPSEDDKSITLGESRSRLQGALHAAFMGAREEGWDKEGAAAVEPETYAYASKFITLLPPSVPLPEIAAESDGDILFEWDVNARHVVSVSVGRDGTIHYAGLFGYAKTHGRENFVETLPLAIASCLERLYPSAR